MNGAQAFKRIPRIRFPQRHPSGSASATQQQQAVSANSEADMSFLTNLNSAKTLGGKASLQPKRTPVSNDEIEAILLGGCI